MPLQRNFFRRVQQIGGLRCFISEGQMITATVGKQSDVVWEPEVEELFREHYGLIYRAAYAVTGRRADAEDVIQNLFLRLVQRELPPEIRVSPKGYLYRAASMSR